MRWHGRLARDSEIRTLTMLDIIHNILPFPRELDRILFRVLENASIAIGPSTQIQHLYSSPATVAACDFPCFDLYQCRATSAYYVRQTGGLLGEVVWYIENKTSDAGSASPDRLPNPQQEP